MRYSCVNDRTTGQKLMTGARRGDLYVLSNLPELYFSSRYLSSTVEVWHQHLGHPQASTLQLLKNKGFVNVLGASKLQLKRDNYCVFQSVFNLKKY